MAGFACHPLVVTLRVTNPRAGTAASRLRTLKAPFGAASGRTPALALDRYLF
jgi:hypothetical protein